MAFLHIPVVFVNDDDDEGDLSAILRKKGKKSDADSYVYVNTNSICSFNETDDGNVEARFVNGDYAVIEMDIEDFEEMLLKVDYIVDISKFITEN